MDTNLRNSAQPPSKDAFLSSMPALGLATAVDIVGAALLIVGRGQPLPTVTAAALHLVATALVAADDRLTGSRRTLTVALVLSLPWVGAALAALVLKTPGRAELVDPEPLDAVPTAVFASDEIRMLADALPACDVLMTTTASGRIIVGVPTDESGTSDTAPVSAPADADETEERRAMLASLTRRGDASAVAVLRWLTASSSDIAVEAALALEELGSNFEVGLDKHRAELAALEREGALSSAAYFRAAIFISRGVTSGIVEPVLMRPLLDEARRYFEGCRKLSRVSSTSFAEIALAWARLELVAMRPEAAVRLIDEGLAADAPKSIRAELSALREEAALARHEPLWEGLAPLRTPHTNSNSLPS